MERWNKSYHGSPPGILHELSRDIPIIFYFSENLRIPAFLLTSSCERQEGKDHYWQIKDNIFLPLMATCVPPKIMCMVLATFQTFLFCYIAALAKSQGISNFGFRQEKILPREFGCDGFLIGSRMFLRSVNLF